MRGVVARDPAWILVKKVRHLLEFYVDLALFLLWFNLVTCHSDLIARCPYIHTAYLLSIIQQLDHIELGHYTQLMCDTGSLDFQVTTGLRVRLQCANFFLRIRTIAQVCVLRSSQWQSTGV